MRLQVAVSATIARRRREESQAYRHHDVGTRTADILRRDTDRGAPTHGSPLHAFLLSGPILLTASGSCDASASLRIYRTCGRVNSDRIHRLSFEGRALMFPRLWSEMQIDDSQRQLRTPPGLFLTRYAFLPKFEEARSRLWSHRH